MQQWSTYARLQAVRAVTREDGIDAGSLVAADHEIGIQRRN